VPSDAKKGVAIRELSPSTFELVGVMDEFADLSPMLQAAAPLRMKMGRVLRFNSIGIRNLMKFLKQWNKGDYEFIDCPVEFVDQVEMIPNILKMSGKGRISSCRAPFTCSSCGHEDELLVSEAELNNAKAKNTKPEKTCSQCRASMTVLAEGFFSFLNA